MQDASDKIIHRKRSRLYNIVSVNALSLLDAFSASHRKLARKGPIVTILSGVCEGHSFLFRGFMQQGCLMCGLEELILECPVVRGVKTNLETGLEVGP